VIDVDHAGKVSTNGNTLDAAQLETLFAAVDKSTDVIIRYGKDTPPEARNAVIGRAQAAGCRVSFVRY
jgi:biopolymer transport protein ExbD